MKKKRFPLYLLVVFSLISIGTFAQKKTQKPAQPKPALSSRETIEPMRVTSGLMTGNRIAVRRSDWIAPGKPVFELKLESARITEGRLEFTCSYRESGKVKAEKVDAKLVSTTARSANPWPSASSSTARDRRPPAAERERGEVSEQTQSLYSAAETGSGCELIYLTLQLPGQRQALQIGVVLAYQDNETGNQINQAICRVTATLKAGADVSETLTKLNQLLANL